MTKPVIVTRAGKGSALTWTEGDANVTNLQNATITIKADTAGTDVVSDLNGSITLVAGNNIALTGDNTAKTVTIDAATPNINLDDLSDVTATGATNGQVLTYNSTMMTWGASSPAGGASQLGDLTDVYFSGPPSDKDLLTFNNTSGKWEPAQLGGIDLLSDVAITAAANGDILYHNGTNWVDQSFSTLLSNATINASTVFVESTNTNATYYPMLASTGTGNVAVATDTSGLIYNPSTNLLTAQNISFTSVTEPIYNIGTTGGTITPNAANGSVQKITLNSALTINNFGSPIAGQSLTLIIYGGTAYTSITSTMKFAGGIKTLTGTAGCIDILSIYFDGTTYFASLGKGFA